MRPIFLVALLFTTVGCQAAQRGAGRYVDSISHENEKRSYIVRVPKSYRPNQPMPVIIALHGLTSNKEQLESVTRIGDKADREGFIAVIPDGTGFARGWNCEFMQLAGSRDDVALMTKILDQVEKDFNVDRKREYIMGHSNGAMMAFLCGAKLSNRLAAVAGISGSIGLPADVAPGKEIPRPKQTIPVLLIHGREDLVVAYDKSKKAMFIPTGAIDSAKWWAKANNCDKTLSVIVSNDGDRKVYGSIRQRNEVILITSNKGTHEIMGGYYASGRETASKINAMDEVWDFFRRQSLR